MEEQTMADIMLQSASRLFSVSASNVQLKRVMDRALQTIQASGQRMSPTTAEREFRIASDALDTLSTEIESLIPNLLTGYEGIGDMLRATESWKQMPLSYRREHPLPLDTTKELSESLSGQVEASSNLLAALARWTATPQLRQAAQRASGVVHNLRDAQASARTTCEELVRAMQEAAASGEKP